MNKSILKIIVGCYQNMNPLQAFYEDVISKVFLDKNVLKSRKS